MLMLFLLAGLLGLLADTAHLQYARQRTQTAADAAAISAYLEFEKGDTAGMRLAAQADAARNGLAGDRVQVEVHCPPLRGEHAADNSAVEVSIVEEAPTLLMGIFGHSAVTVAARAVAMKGSNGRVTLGE